MAIAGEVECLRPTFKRKRVRDDLFQGQGPIEQARERFIEALFVIAGAHDLKLVNVQAKPIHFRGLRQGAEKDETPARTQRGQAGSGRFG